MGAEGVARHWHTKASGQSKFIFEDNLKVAKAGHTPTGWTMGGVGGRQNPLAVSAPLWLSLARLCFVMQISQQRSEGKKQK